MGPLGIYVLYHYYKFYGATLVAVAVTYGGPIAHALCMLLPLKMIKWGKMDDTTFTLSFFLTTVILPCFLSQFFATCKRTKRQIV